MGIGVVWGVICWLFTRFLVARFLESIMLWKPVRWLDLQNDYRPNFENSKHEGEKYRRFMVERRRVMREEGKEDDLRCHKCYTNNCIQPKVRGVGSVTLDRARR